MKNNLIALVIFAFVPFANPVVVFAQAAPDELLEEAPSDAGTEVAPGASTETDDLLSEMDAGTASTPEAPAAAQEAVSKAVVPPASNAGFEKIEALGVSDADLVTFMKSGGLRSRLMK